MGLSTTIKTGLTALPSDLEDLVEVEIPAVTVPSIPTTESEAIIAMGVQARNEALIWQAFEGMKPYKNQLYAGMMSPAQIAQVILSAQVSEGTYDASFDSWEESYRLPGESAESAPGCLGQQQFMSESYLSSLNTFVSGWESWIEGVVAGLEADLVAQEAGDELPYQEGDIAELPDTITLPVPINPALPAPIYWFLWLVKLLNHPLVHIAAQIVSTIIKNIRQGADMAGFVKLFKKFAFLKEGDKDLGFADLTSLLLLNADKPIEIFDSLGKSNIFLDNRVREEGE